MSNQTACNGSTPNKPDHAYSHYNAQGAGSDQASLRNYRLAQFQSGPASTPMFDVSNRGAAVREQIDSVVAAFNKIA
ncbi:hypothetical protein ED733_002086 [Metarhizium rileyi]|nr:hypothetical protein ED733_002086 [Metarhizium rileyi]